MKCLRGCCKWTERVYQKENVRRKGKQDRGKLKKNEKTHKDGDRANGNNF